LIYAAVSPPFCLISALPQEVEAITAPLESETATVALKLHGKTLPPSLREADSVAAAAPTGFTARREAA
jgi:hypothetical protein